MDLSNAITVEEHVRRSGHHKLWLCPSLVSDGRINVNPLWQGIECTSNTIPDKIKSKLVRERFRDGGFECIIWENDEDISFLEEAANGN